MPVTPTPKGIIEALRSCGDKGRAKQWLQFLSRIAEVVNLLFSTEREVMFNHRFIKGEYAKGVHNLTYERPSAPAARNPFCDAGVDNTTKLQALYFGQCVHSVILSTPLLVYLSSDCDIRVREYDIYVNPQVITRSTNTGTLNNFPVHSIFFVAPSFLPVAAIGFDPSKDPGMILDPSARQMGFKETISCAANYFSNKFNSRREGHRSRPLGTHLNRIKAGLLNSPPSFCNNNSEFRQEISLRVICNAVYEEIERWGGPRVVVSLEAAVWEHFFDTLRARLERDLRQLRVRVDDLEFAGLRIEDMEDRAKDLMSQYYQGGYRNMMALASDLYS
ncbi:hypothetical protein DPSP01_013282 [Paraphaeosphaeria sporulosa]